MARSFFKSNLSGSYRAAGNPTKKTAAPLAPQTSASASSLPMKGGTEVKVSAENGVEGQGTLKHSADKVVVYGDVVVCNYLGIRRRVLNDARTIKSRGIDWECVGGHAGMTKKWIDGYALKNGTVPNFGIVLDPIAEGDGVVSVRLVGTHPNPGVCIVERMDDGSRAFARVRNLMEHPIHLHECFDCVVEMGNLEWIDKHNRVKY